MQSKLSKLLNPDSVAIVGVSENPSRIGGRLFKYLLKHGYRGRLALVNPKYESLKDFPCFPSVLDIPYPIECALISVSESQVLPVLNECADKSIESAIVFSSGFAEMGEEGKEAQNCIRDLARKRNLRICGPNCIGVINFNDSIALSFSQFLETEGLMPGSIGFVSQSGALGGSLVNRAQDQGIGLSCFISSGNEADLDIADYINHLVLDDKTTVIAAVVEGFKDGSKFLKAAELAWSHHKPLIVYKIGETESGKKAAASHTGSMTGSDAVIDAIFKQKGIIRVRNYDDLLQTADLFAKGRIPKGCRVGIVTSSGGAGIIMADHYTKCGLQIPEPSQKTEQLARAEISSFGKVSNPFDLTGQIFSNPEMFRRCMKIFVEDENFDIVQVNVSMVASESATQRAAMLIESVQGASKPIVSWWAAGSLSNGGVEALQGSDVRAFRAPDRCAAAVHALVQYSQYRERLGRQAACLVPSSTLCAEKANEILQSAEATLGEHQSKALLRSYGIPVTREHVATSAEEAARFANAIGFPVALKIASPDILHKSEADAIRLGVRSRREVVDGYDALVRNVARHCPGARIDGVLVQEMIQGGTELIVGVSRDPQFGPMVAFGLGGIFVEVLKDISIRGAPLTRLDAEEMVAEIKGAQILRGVRGKKQADIDAVVDVLLRISVLAKDFEEKIAEVDINPLVVLEDGRGAKAVDALVIRNTKPAGEAKPQQAH